MGFDFNPSYGSWASDTLTDRKRRVKNKDPKWTYQRYAYFQLSGVPRGLQSSADRAANAKDSDTVFKLQSRLKMDSIGQVNDSSHLNLYTDSDGPRKFKPILTSATITANGGGDIYDSYISEINVDFKVFTMEDLKKVESNFFILGADATISYGWAGETNKNLRGTAKMTIYNFGFTMESDGSFNCNVKGLTGGGFMGAQDVSSAIKLTPKETQALGDDAADIASLPSALYAKAYHAFGTTAKAAAANWPSFTKSGIAGPEGKTTAGLAGASSSFGGFYVGSVISTEGKDPVRMMHPYLTFEDLIRFIAKYANTEPKENFSFYGPTSIKPKTWLYGSADPRSYIFPGDKLSYYGESLGQAGGSTPGGSGFHKSNFAVSSNNDIRYILIAVPTIDKFYKELSESAEQRKNEKSTPVKTIDLIRNLSNDINRLSGGLVDIQVVTDSSNKHNYLIFNNTEAQKKSLKSAYEFELLADDNIVKNVSLTSDFDVDTMLMMTVGRARKGEFNVTPLQKLYPNIPDKSHFSAPSPFSMSAMGSTKHSVYDYGIDDAKVSAILDVMRKNLAHDDTDGTFVSLPFYLKLNVTLDGIANVGFLQPITIDRLPKNYKDNVRFLIIGVEHTFDGQGGWDTSLDTVMKVG